MINDMPNAEGDLSVTLCGLLPPKKSLLSTNK